MSINELKEKLIRQLTRLIDRKRDLESKHKGNEEKFTYWGGHDYGYVKGQIREIENTVDLLEELEENIRNGSPVFHKLRQSLDKDEYISGIIMYHKSRKREIDSYDSLQFIGYSLLDKNFIVYKIKSLDCKIPKDYEAILELDKYLESPSNLY